MRILFLTLLVLNLGFLAYHMAFGGGDTISEDVVLPGQDVATLEPLPPPEDSGPEEDAGTGRAGEDGAARAAARATASATEGRPDDGSPDAEKAESGAASRSGAGSKETSAPAPTPEVAVPETTGGSSDPGDPEERGTTGSTRPTCYALGPLSPELLDRVEARVAETPLRIVERWQGDRSESRYWVHLPPAPDMDGARERQEALKAAGYRDILLVRNGDMARSISLGVFANRANASQHQQRLQADGFDARITEQSRKTRAPFLGLKVPEGAGGSVAGVRRLVEQEEAALTERPCDGLHQQ
ncbi:hypothetical protein SAMN05660831_02192 [Thiohalospira halophila DSM 15071]|uniref:SPOR domain-containing protein n=1 Tax=Thiohalospira halophila DSM 15071 TaxID=1123397 RepID=A0A1I1UT98_9GAMM|nr:SPOR domain-containing protein [Thiohalospira halophila]SFD73825.1 hypothetical protein SAMN05660831_02192 [Thiohalospira halophila DSM 15071]